MKIIIVPDVHGRTFWRKCKDLINSVDKIIFLGDYLDPYIDLDLVYPPEAFDEFVDILQFKKDNPDKVILLLGNHDIHYFPELLDAYGCRRFERRKHDISKLFVENINLFKITHCEGKYLFSHAGILQGWLDYIQSDSFFELWKINNVEDFKNLNVEDLTNLLFIEHGLNVLWMISRERGGRAMYGSCVWADVHEHLNYFIDPLPNYYQIFSHSYYYPTLSEYYKDEHLAMLDCAKLFKLENDELIEIC